MATQTILSSGGGVSKGVSQIVKLVIWDLDDTFWRGTLSEGEVALDQANADLVRTLAGRGIIASICSRNDFSVARDKLIEFGMWDFFVFPAIQWASKGPAIKETIARANLRAENVLFIDDNPTNLAEAQYHCPGLMCLDSPQALAESLESDFLRGAADPGLTRLAQYRLLEARYAEQSDAGLSNVEFLRQSGITVEFDYNVEDHLDRIIELLNRTNQLNFTKRRIASDEDRQKLEEDLKRFGFKAAVVKVRDRYGDYGVAGFFMTLATLKVYRYEHLVFSCRIMNMGVEQFVHEYLNKPDIAIQVPVANGLEPFDRVDWITEATHEQNLTGLKKHKVLLIGGCDMLQVSSYCSAESVEFTNRADGDLMIRFDDPNFFLANREMVRASELRRQIPAWTADDMAAFEPHLADADLIVVSFYEMMTVTYFRGTDGLTVRFHLETLKEILKSERAVWFVRTFAHVNYTFEERLANMRLSVETIARRSKEQAKVVLLLENLRRMDHNPGEAERRARYNAFVHKMAAQIPKLRLIDVNATTNPQWIIDGWHMTRQGYLELARQVMKFADEQNHPSVADR